jgi:hypothetical protein
MRRGFFLCFLALLPFFACDSSDDSSPRILQGEFLATLTETGELEAVNARVIVMPWIGWQYGRPKLAYLVPEGTQVISGDLVAQMDTVGIVRVLGEKERDLQIAEADLRNLIVSQVNQKSQLEGQITSSEAAFTLAKIQLEKMKFESERKQTVSQLRFEKETLALKKLQDQLKMLQIKQENELKIQQLRIVQLENVIRSAHRARQKARLTATNNGLVEYRINERTGEKVRAGDEMWPSAPIAGLPDMSQMKVKATVSETDISKIALGQSVVIRLDAFPNIEFHGKLVEIAKLCHKKAKEDHTKVFDIIILIEESNPILKPGMTVSCEIITAKLKDALFVANEYLVEIDSRYYLSVKKGSKFQPREVRPGPRNNEFTVIYGDVKAGQRIEHFKPKGATDGI